MSSDLIIKMILPCVGILIILLCIGAYFFKYGTTIKDKIQKFKMFGADLQISIMTVFVLVGLIFIFAGTYVNIVDTNSKLANMLDEERKKGKEFEAKVIELNSALETFKQSQNKTIDYFLELDGRMNLPNPKDLKICCKVWGDEDKEVPLNCTIVTLNDQQRLTVTIPEINSKTFITSMSVEELSTGKKWKACNFFPLSPSLKLSAF